MSSTWTYCPTCNKPYAHTLGVMGYAGPPFWCECPDKITGPIWPNDPQPLDKHYILETIQLRERVKELEKIPVFMVDYHDAYGYYPSDKVIREQFNINY